LLASGSDDKTVRIWDAHTGLELALFETPQSYAWRLAWAPDGAFLVSGHSGNPVRLWDTRHLTQRTLASMPTPPVSGPLPAHLRVLPAALAQVLRLGLTPPLALLRDLVELIGGQAVPAPLDALASLPGTRALQALRWP